MPSSAGKRAFFTTKPAFFVPMNENFISTKRFVLAHNLAGRTVQNYCMQGKTTRLCQTHTLPLFSLSNTKDGTNKRYVTSSPVCYWAFMFT